MCLKLTFGHFYAKIYTKHTFINLFWWRIRWMLILWTQVFLISSVDLRGHWRSYLKTLMQISTKHIHYESIRMKILVYKINYLTWNKEIFFNIMKTNYECFLKVDVIFHKMKYDFKGHFNGFERFHVFFTFIASEYLI